MSQKQGPDIHTTCMDGVHVKISEKYKPPPRINLAMTYSQRISLNKQIQDHMPRYDFNLEMSIKEKMKEWRTARNLIAFDRREKLEIIKEEYYRKKQEEKVKREQELENELTSNYAGVLIPTQVNTNNYTNILTPTPLPKQTVKVADKSPINISDFETDNSSPFDNMELKTINDMEELKLVLQNDDKNFAKQPSYQYPSYGYNAAAHSSNQTYMYANGYNYYTPETLHPTYSMYDYNNPPSKTEYSSSFDAQTPAVANKAPFRSVPDIMQALQTELNNTHIENKMTLPSHSSKTPAKSTDLENPYDYLPKNLQDICGIISSMGFPMPRVARVCREFGDDQKKIVEHLLVMSELLDLGFSEDEVSTALLKCNNDRDKALELLIS